MRTIRLILTLRFVLSLHPWLEESYLRWYGRDLLIHCITTVNTMCMSAFQGPVSHALFQSLGLPVTVLPGDAKPRPRLESHMILTFETLNKIINLFLSLALKMEKQYLFPR